LRAAPGLLLASFADAAVLPAHSGDECHRRCPLVLRQGRRFARCVFTPRWPPSARALSVGETLHRAGTRHPAARKVVIDCGRRVASSRLWA